MPSVTQNWDGVTAPAVPSTWNYTSGTFVTSSSLAGGLVPTSSPNAAAVTGGETTATQYAGYESQDGNGGNVALQANFAATANGTGFLICRCTDSPANAGSSSYYDASININTKVVAIAVVNSGSPTTLVSLSASTLATDTWYTLFLVATLSSLSASVQRHSDGEWLNASGSFQVGQTTCLTTTDSSISGAGYFGLGLFAKLGSSYSDDFSEGPAPPQVGFPYGMKVVSRPLLPIHVSGYYD